ncbi:hypothetical protein BZA77DRAFT_322801, partial [Pyronema omphalodes]
MIALCVTLLVLACLSACLLVRLLAISNRNYTTPSTICMYVRMYVCRRAFLCVFFKSLAVMHLASSILYVC